MSKTIGIDENTKLIYEGSSNYGYGLWPSPVISPATFVTITNSQFNLPVKRDLFSIEYLFREEGFDPLSRTRRGRFYKRNSQQPQQWFLQPHPVLIHERRHDGVNEIRKSLYTYFSFDFSTIVKTHETENTLIFLGHEDSYSIWSIINIESTATNEELVTLKLRPTFGVLPKLLNEKLPSHRLETIQTVLDKFSIEIHRAGPESVIDRGRDAAAAILGAYVEQQQLGRFDHDLHALIKKIKNSGNDKRRRVAESAANIVRLFHARAKPSEQERRNPRRITEQDAELAINCIGTILCEFGWAYW